MSSAPRVIELIPRPKRGARSLAALGTIFEHCMKLAGYGLVLFALQCLTGGELVTFIAWAIIVGLMALGLVAIVDTYHKHMEE